MIVRLRYRRHVHVPRDRVLVVMVGTVRVVGASISDALRLMRLGMRESIEIGSEGVVVVVVGVHHLDAKQGRRERKAPRLELSARISPRAGTVRRQAQEPLRQHQARP